MLFRRLVALLSDCSDALLDLAPKCEGVKAAFFFTSRTQSCRTIKRKAQRFAHAFPEKRDETKEYCTKQMPSDYFSRKQFSSIT